MHLGRYIRWDPLPDLVGGGWNVESVHDDYEGFRLILRLHPYVNRRWRLWFRRALLYEVTNDSFRVSGSNEQKDDLSGPHHHFFTVDGSSLLADFHRGAAGVYADWAITHYAIYSETCVDVLSVEPPIIEELPAERPVA